MTEENDDNLMLNGKVVHCKVVQWCDPISVKMYLICIEIRLESQVTGNIFL